MRTELAGLVIALLIAGAAHAAPVPLYDSFGPGDSFDTSSGWTIGFGSTNGNAGYSWALQFTPSVSATVSTLEVALFREGGGNQVTGMILTDSGGLPGSVLETFSFVNVTGAASIYLTTSSTNSVLQAGTLYWFVLTAPDLLNDEFGWHRNLNPPFVPNAQRLGSGSWLLRPDEYRGTLRVMGEAVPEPGPWALGASALALLGVWRRRSRATTRPT